MGLGSLKPVTGGHKLLHRPSCPAVFLRRTTSLYMAVSWTSQVQSFIHPLPTGRMFSGCSAQAEQDFTPSLDQNGERGEELQSKELCSHHRHGPGSWGSIWSVLWVQALGGADLMMWLMTMGSGGSSRLVSLWGISENFSRGQSKI